MKSLKNFILWLNALSAKSVERFGAQYDAFSVFIFVFYLANPLKWHFSGPYAFSVIAFLRMGAVFLWLILLLWRLWPKRLKKFLPLFWHFALLYHLPFRTTFSTLYSPHSPSFDSFGLLGIVALAVLVDDKAFCILTALGCGLGTLVFFAFGGLSIPSVKIITLVYASLMVFSIAFIKLILFRNHNINLNEKSKAYKILAGAIAHEVRGPICTLNLASENLIKNKNINNFEQITIVKQQSKKVLRIVDSILLQVRFLEI
jgi:signal transduction histidine kinase